MMQNYSYKVKNILKRHKNHTRYIIVFFLLSAFVVSFVCSALMKPAVSMTNDEYTHVDLSSNLLNINNNVSILEAQSNTDNLPIIETGYANSIFSYYFDESAYLGIAQNFHLFAFKNLKIEPHCNGNFAAPNVEIKSYFGNNQADNAGGEEISIVSNSITKLGTGTVDRILLIPNNVFVSDNNNVAASNPILADGLRILNEAFGVPKGSNIYHIYGDNDNEVSKDKYFINFEDERNNFITKCSGISNKISTNNWEITNNNTLTITNEDANEENVVTLDKDKVSNLESLNIITTGNKPLIINVDLNGVGNTFDLPFQVQINGNGSKEDNVKTGTNVLWNFYDSSKSDKMYTGEISFLKAFFGAVLLPNGKVTAKTNYDGTIIANEIHIAGGESHKCTFMRGIELKNSVSVKKEWNTAEDANLNKSLKFQLYKTSHQVSDLNNLLDSDKCGEEVIVTAKDNWVYTWYNLDQIDSSGNKYYYYIKELPVNGYDISYTDNGLQKSGVVKVKNTRNSQWVSPDDNPAEMKLNINKVWKPSSENTPDDVKFTLYKTTDTNKTFGFTDADKVTKDKDGTTITNPITLKKSDGWTTNIANLPTKDESGNLFYYHVVESDVGGYTVSYSGNGANTRDSTITITNTEIEKTSITINKIWQDQNGGNASAPGSITEITFDLYSSTTKSADGKLPTDAALVEGKSDLKITSAGTWMYKIDNLPKTDSDSKTLYYYVVEKSTLSDYTVSYNNNGVNSGSITINNKYTPNIPKISLTVNKRWIDNNSSNRPDITLTLQRKLSDSGAWQDYDFVQPTPTKNGNTWTYTYSNLPAYDTNGTTKYYYRVVEKSNPSGYIKVSADSNGVAIDSTDKTITILNIKTLSLNLTKNWSDPDAQHNDITVEIHRSINSNDVPKQTLITNAPITKTYTFNNLPQNSKPTNGGDYIASVSNSFQYKLNSSDSYTNGTISSDGRSTISNVPADNSYIKYQVGAVYELDLTRIKSGDTVTFKFNSDNKDNTNFGYYSNKSGGFVGFSKSNDNTYSVKITDDISHYEFQCWSNELEITDTSSLNFTSNGMSSLIEVTVTAASAPSGNVLSGTITDYSSSPVIELAQTQIRKAKFTFSGNQWDEAKIKIKKSTNETKKIKLGFFSNNNSNICIEDDRSETDADWSNWVEENSYSISGQQRVFKDNSITFTFTDDVDSIQIEIIKPDYKFTSIEYVVSDDSTAQFKSAFKISGLNLLASNQGSNSNTDATLVQEVTLGSNNSWTKTISDLPMYDESGNVYYYWVEEKFVNGYQSSYQYGDSPGDTGYITGNNGNITILNTKVTSGSIEMPSTGGKGINDYRNAGIIMMTASAGIYIALKILKKKSMEFK